MLTLNEHTRPWIVDHLLHGGWVVACLCAQWCRHCREYQARFAQISETMGLDAHGPSDVLLVWVDVEDHADLFTETAIDNFPTLLIQCAQTVVFFGAMAPEVRRLQRLIKALHERSMTALIAESTSTAQRRQWQTEVNLLR